MAAATSNTSLGVTLRPPPLPEDPANALPQLVHRIATERDGLKNVTEAKLRQKIADEAAGIGQELADQDEGDNQPKDVLAQQKELWAAKNELVQFLDQARNPIAMALDTTSFQLREHAPQSAEQTLSPYIKQNFKQGALGLDKLEPRARPKTELDTDEITATGWSLESLNRSADVLLQSAQKLNQEVEKETRYWQAVSDVKKKGWSISRIPRQRNTVGVKFGFSEAGPLFQAQGLAALRANEVGDIVLDRGLVREHKAIRVRVEENGRVVGQSRDVLNADATSDIEGHIHKARDSLFEDELFHEMICEARTLLAYNVKLVQDAIRLPLPTPVGSPDRYLAISLEERPNHMSSEAVVDADQQASATALACRVLLTHLYRERFRRRSRPPAPLSAEKTTEAGSHVLKTLLNFTHHRASIDSLDSFFSSLSPSITSAGAKLTCETVQGSTVPATNGKTPMECLVESMTGPHKTVQALTLTFDSQKFEPKPTTIAVEIKTALSEPTFGSSLRILSAPTSQIKNEGTSAGPPAQMPDLESLFRYLKHKICLALVKYIVQQQPSWRQTEPTATDLVKTSVDEQGGSGETLKARVRLGMQHNRLVLVGGQQSGVKKVLSVWPSAAGQQTIFESIEDL